MIRAGLLLGLIVLLSGCSTPALPTFEVLVDQAGDQVDFEIAGDEVRFDVHSQSGIGHAKVELTSGQWPERVLFRVHKSGLGSFKFSYPGSIIEVAVQSGNDRQVLRSAMQIGKELQPAGEGTKFFMPVTIDDNGGWVEVQAPSDFHELEPGHFQIDWVDVYR